MKSEDYLLAEAPTIESLSTAEAEALKPQLKSDLKLLNFDSAGELELGNVNSKWVLFVARGATAKLSKIEDMFYKHFTDKYAVKRLIVELDNFKATKRGNDVEIEADYAISRSSKRTIKESANSEYYLLIKSRYSTQFKHTMKQYLVWTKKDLQTYEPKAYGATMDAAIATFNKVREDREEEEYIESLGAIESSKRYASKETDTLNKAKADIMKISPEAKAALSAVSGSAKGLTEGEFIPVKDLEAKAKKLNPQKEAKLKAALAKVDLKRAEVAKFMKTYNPDDEKQRLERVKLGGELAAAMNAYLELV